MSLNCHCICADSQRDSICQYVELLLVLSQKTILCISQKEQGFALSSKVTVRYLNVKSLNVNYLNVLPNVKLYIDISSPQSL